MIRVDSDTNFRRRRPFTRIVAACDTNELLGNQCRLPLGSQGHGLAKSAFERDDKNTLVSRSISGQTAQWKPSDAHGAP